MNLASLQLDSVSSDELAAQSASWWRTVLGVVGFDERPAGDFPQVPIAASMTPALGGGSGCEVWRMTEGRAPEARTLRKGRVTVRYGNDFLFGALAIEESEFDSRGSAALLDATAAAYREIFGVLEQTGYHHLIRVWNYLPEINAPVDGEERYRHFNSARQAAFQQSGRSTVGTVPAACALGSPAGSPISIYFLACSRPPIMIENPRQTSAYFYPPSFGVSSPTFSRACVVPDLKGTNLFISGTASIVGFETRHAGDVTAQTRETLANIEALLGEANRLAGSPAYALDTLKYKAYVRHPADLPAISGVLADVLPASVPIVYLKADVCREDLLVEIEATGESRQ